MSDRKHVYFMACGVFTKVGIAADPYSRHASIQGTNPHEVILDTISDEKPLREARRIEVGCHYVMASRRVRGEWFAVPVRDAVDVAIAVQGIAEERGVSTKDGHRVPYLQLNSRYRDRLDALRAAFDAKFSGAAP